MKKSKFNKKWQIFVPKNIRHNLVEWHNKALMHPGIKRMEENVLLTYTAVGSAKYGQLIAK